MSQEYERDLLTALRYRQVHTKRDGSVSDVAGPPTLLSLVGNWAVGSLLGRVIQRCGPNHPDCDCPTEARGEAPAGRTSVGAPLSLSMVTQLQRLAGNAAVARFLQRDDEKQSEESGDEATEESGNICGLEVGGPGQDTDQDSMVAQGSFVDEPRSRISLHQGGATVVCDGSGGFRVDLRSAADYPCGLAGCTESHERSHIRDHRANPKTKHACKERPDGSKPDYSKMTPEEQRAWAIRTECSAYRVSLACVTKLLKANTKTEDPLACKEALTKYQTRMTACTRDKECCAGIH